MINITFIVVYHDKHSKVPRFDFVDVGIANYLLKRGRIELKSEPFGHAFKHFIFQELVAHSHYSGLDYGISYWRTASQLEVDFILGDNDVAIEVKSTHKVSSRHLRGLKAFCEEYKTKHAIAVSLDARPRIVQGIHILPWKEFCLRLWNGDIIN